MSKINIKCELECSSYKYVFEGEGIFKDNSIIYNDSGVMTKLIIDDVVWLIRKKDYEMKLGFCTDKCVKGTYIISEGIFETLTDTFLLTKYKNGIKIKYLLKINDEVIDTFELNLFYSIDSG